MLFGQGHQRACLGASALPHRRARCRRPDSQILSDLRRQVSRGGRKRPEAAVGGTRTSSWMLTTNAGKSAPGLLSAAAAKLCCTYMGSSSATYAVMQPGQNPLVPPPLPGTTPARPPTGRPPGLVARPRRTPWPCAGPAPDGRSHECCRQVHGQPCAAPVQPPSAGTPTSRGRGQRLHTGAGWLTVVH